jgi:hypothetical protein
MIATTAVKNFGRAVNADGTALLSTDESNELLLGYTARALPHLGNIAREVLYEFPDGAIEFDLERQANGLSSLVAKLATVQWPSTK